MSLAYFDAFSGVSGDMTLGAMVDAGLPAEKLTAELAKLPVDGYTIKVDKVKRLSLAATKVTVRLEPKAHTAHRHYPDIMRLIDKSALAPEVKEVAGRIFTTLGEAEAAIHGVELARVHFHEVGAVDSIVDIVGAAVGFCELGIDEVAVSAVNTGHGTVRTEHGVLPVPAPATARMLAGAPTYASGPAVELTTPTGAAIIRAMASSFGPQPLMTVDAIGHGAGGMELEDRPNVLRLMIGHRTNNLLAERLVELATNIDNMNPQGFGAVTERLFRAGALDVTCAPALMKKGRPALILSVLARPHDTQALERIIFEHTTTLGIRRTEVDRVSLARAITQVDTRYGKIEVKTASLPWGGKKVAPEFESVKAAAAREGAAFDAVYWEAVRGAMAAGRTRE